VSSRLAAEQTYLDARAEADALDAEAGALAAQLSGLGAGGDSVHGVLLSLRAPISGTVIERQALVGQPVLVEEAIGAIADLSDVWFLARVFEKDLGRLRVGAVAEVELNAYPAERFPGTIEYISHKIDSVARTVTARIRLTNRDGRLRVGLFGSAQVTLASERKEPALVVSRRALIELADKYVVFVRQPDGQFERHDVTLGETAPGKVQILSGLREGEQVRRCGCRSTRCRTSPTSRCRSSPRRRRSRPSRSSSTSPSRSSGRWRASRRRRRSGRSRSTASRSSPSCSRTDTDIYFARQLVGERMREAQDDPGDSTASPRWGRSRAVSARSSSSR
jgi:hypothetical protein